MQDACFIYYHILYRRISHLYFFIFIDFLIWVNKSNMACLNSSPTFSHDSFSLVFSLCSCPDPHSAVFDNLTRMRIYPPISTIKKTSGYIINSNLSKTWKICSSSRISIIAKILNIKFARRTLALALKRGAGRLNGKINALNTSPMRKTIDMTIMSQILLFINRMIW